MGKKSKNPRKVESAPQDNTSSPSPIARNALVVGGAAILGGLMYRALSSQSTMNLAQPQGSIPQFTGIPDEAPNCVDIGGISVCTEKAEKAVSSSIQKETETRLRDYNADQSNPCAATSTINIPKNHKPPKEFETDKGHADDLATYLIKQSQKCMAAGGENNNLQLLDDKDTGQLVVTFRSPEPKEHGQCAKLFGFDPRKADQIIKNAGDEIKNCNNDRKFRDRIKSGAGSPVMEL